MDKRMRAYLLLALSLGYLFLASFTDFGKGFPQLLWVMGLLGGVAMFQLRSK